MFQFGGGGCGGVPLASSDLSSTLGFSICSIMVPEEQAGLRHPQSGRRKERSLSSSPKKPSLLIPKASAKSLLPKGPDKAIGPNSLSLGLNFPVCGQWEENASPHPCFHGNCNRCW